MKFYITFWFVLLLLLGACDRVKNKTKELKDQVEQSVKDGIDMVFPTFDPYEADTEVNKERFRDFLQVELTPDIHNIYCYADQMGIDAKYQFGFYCDSNSVSRIIDKHSLKPIQSDTSLVFPDPKGLQTAFDWWEIDKVNQLPTLAWTDGGQYFKYFWYDKSVSKAYYMEFDM